MFCNFYWEILQLGDYFSQKSFYFYSAGLTSKFDSLTFCWCFLDFGLSDCNPIIACLIWKITFNVLITIGFLICVDEIVLDNKDDIWI